MVTPLKVLVKIYGTITMIAVAVERTIGNSLSIAVAPGNAVAPPPPSSDVLFICQSDSESPEAPPMI